MPRPRTKSPVIQFRIDIELWPLLIAWAEKRGQTVPAFVCERLEDILRPPSNGRDILNVLLGDMMDRPSVTNG